MNNIKAGQVYKDGKEHDAFVVSKVRQLEDYWLVTTIHSDGFACDCPAGSLDDMPEDYELIAEYPTWQEAINSKEFNNA